MTTRNAAEATGRGAAQPDMASASAGRGLRRTTGGLFVAGAVAFAAAAMVLSSTFNWPDILREPAGVVLPAFAGGGTSLGEHLGQLLVIGWSVTLCVIIVRTRVLPRWLGVTGLAASALYLLNQGDILATAIPGFQVLGPGRPDRQNPAGESGWPPSGVTIVLRPAPATLQGPPPATRPATAGPPRSRAPHLHAATTPPACRSHRPAVD
jgi:hypothetical protein